MKTRPHMHGVISTKASSTDVPVRISDVHDLHQDEIKTDCMF